ncbi:MAG TPA: ribose 5-phosphate isomerase B [Anaerolineaceae bacterium]|nr:ribose 5-phosphate isomerase B [Anaerolineaceae bacterium]
MRVAVAADHAGYPIKDIVLDVVRDAGHEAIDLGTYSLESVDYPDYAEKLGTAIQQGQADRGILVCGSGIGACVAANKMHGIYASICHDTYSAAQGVEHDDLNVLCMGARVIGIEVAKAVVKAFLGASFSTEERHRRRVAKVHAIEERNSSQ